MREHHTPNGLNQLETKPMEFGRCACITALLQLDNCLGCSTGNANVNFDPSNPSFDPLPRRPVNCTNGGMCRPWMSGQRSSLTVTVNFVDTKLQTTNRWCHRQILSCRNSAPPSVLVVDLFNTPTGPPSLIYNSQHNLWHNNGNQRNNIVLLGAMDKMMQSCIILFRYYCSSSAWRTFALPRVYTPSEKRACN